MIGFYNALPNLILPPLPPLPPLAPLPPLPALPPLTPLPALPLLRPAPFLYPLNFPAPERHFINPIPNMSQPAITPATSTPCVSNQNNVSSANFPREENALQWIRTTPQNAQALCDKAVVGGYDYIEGSPLWVIRAKLEGDLIPGKLVIKRCAASVPWNGKEYYVNDIEVCCARPEKIRWVESSGNSVPENAVVAGHTSRGEPLYVGRAKEQGSLIPGKVDLSHNALYITFAELEIAHDVYEVLCVV